MISNSCYYIISSNNIHAYFYDMYDNIIGIIELRSIEQYTDPNVSSKKEKKRVIALLNEKSYNKNRERLNDMLDPNYKKLFRPTKLKIIKRRSHDNILCYLNKHGHIVFCDEYSGPKILKSIVEYCKHFSHYGDRIDLNWMKENEASLTFSSR